MQVKNAFHLRKDALNFEEMVIEARTLEEEFGKQAPVQSHIQQARNSESILQPLVKKVKVLEGIIKRKELLTCIKCGIPGHLSFDFREDTGIECYRCRRKGHVFNGCRVRLNADWFLLEIRNKNSDPSPTCNLAGGLCLIRDKIGGKTCVAVLDYGSSVTTIANSLYDRRLIHLDLLLLS